MAYEQEYELSKGNKIIFIKLMQKRYKDLKDATILRRWYDCKIKSNVVVQKEIKKQYEHKYLPEEMLEPQRIKMFMFEDAKRYKIKITKKWLRQYRFNEPEINWLDNKGMVDEE